MHGNLNAHVLLWPRGNARLSTVPVALIWLLSIGFFVPLETASKLSAAERIDVSAEVLEAQQRRAEVIQAASAATISIFGLDGGGGGSGVIVTPDGYALTNYHVSSACGDHMRCGLNDGSMVDAVIVGIDATGDLSLIKLLGRDDFPTAPLADSSQVRVGQWCFAAGNPFMLASNRQPSISLGIVSGTNRYQYPAGTLLEYADCIQTDAAINPGNSGGPLFNLAGEIIGINGRCSFEKRGRINVGVGYAISSNQVRYFMDVLRSGRLVDHATLGATVSTDPSGRIVVSNILSSSDAFRRGLRYGDEVLSLADREVKTTNMFKNILGTLPKGWRVPMVVRSNGEQRALLVRLEGVHTEKQLIELVSPERQAPKPPAPESPEPDNEKAEQEPAARNQSATDQAKPPLPDSLQLLLPDKEKVQSMLQAREGFANYYFNALHQTRLWDQLRSNGDLTQTKSDWQFEGTLAGEKTPFQIKLEEGSGVLQIGSRERSVDFNDSISELVAQRDESGLLVALKAWQQLLRQGPRKIGDSIYLGAMPVYPGQSLTLADQPRMDVLETLWFDAKARFSFNADGQVALIEVFGDAKNDPVELYLDQYETSNEDLGKLPKRFRLQYGMQTVLMLESEDARLQIEPEIPQESGKASPESSEASPESSEAPQEPSNAQGTRP